MSLERTTSCLTEGTRWSLDEGTDESGLGVGVHRRMSSVPTLPRPLRRCWWYCSCFRATNRSMAESLALKGKVCGCGCGRCGEAGEVRVRAEVGEAVEIVFGFCALGKVLFGVGEEKAK